MFRTSLGASPAPPPPAVLARLRAEPPESSVARLTPHPACRQVPISAAFTTHAESGVLGPPLGALRSEGSTKQRLRPTRRPARGASLPLSTAEARWL